MMPDFQRRIVKDPNAPGGEWVGGYLLTRPGERMETDEEFKARIKASLAEREADDGDEDLRGK